MKKEPMLTTLYKTISLIFCTIEYFFYRFLGQIHVKFVFALMEKYFVGGRNVVSGYKVTTELFNYFTIHFQDHHLRKPPKKPKHHSHRKQQNAWLKGIPQSVVNFPQHLPTHLINENVDIEAQNNNTVSTKISASPISVINAMDSPSSTIPENVFNANDTNEPNEHQTSNDMNDKLRIITANPIIIDNKITVEARNSNDEKGYYEKTIINKNGVFIENIRKIANVVDENILFNKANDDVENENINRKRIELMNVPLSQHYVITSSGKIEKTDALASDDVIAQFRDGLNDFQTSPKPVILNTNGVRSETSVGPKATTTATTTVHPDCIVMGMFLLLLLHCNCFFQIFFLCMLLIPR